MPATVGAKIQLDGAASYRSQMTNLTSASKALSAQMKALKSSFDSEATAEQKNRAIKQQLTAQIDVQKQRIAALQAQIQKTSAEYGEGSTQVNRYKQQLAQAENALNGMESELRQVNAELKNQPTAFQTSMTNLSKSLDTVSTKLKSAGDSLKSFGQSYTTHVSLPMVAVGAGTVKAAIDIDTALTGVRKTVDATEEEYQALKDAAIEYSKTQPVSAEQLLDLEALGAQLGYSKDELENFAKVVAGLDIATDMDAETAATELAQFANITQMSHEDTERFASAIVALGNSTATTESQISAMAQRTAAAGTQVGMTQSQILGWSAAMASLGIEAEAGGTAFSQTVSTIDAAVATGSEDLQAFAEVAGMSGEEFSNAWKEDATGTFQRLLEGIANSDNATVALEKMGITGVRAQDVMKRLSGNTELVAQALGTANEGWEQNTALTDEVANRNDSLAAKFDTLKNKLTAIAEEVGEPLANALLAVADDLQPVVDKVADLAQRFAELDPEQQKTILGFMGVVAALGPVLSLLGSGISAIGSLVGGISAITGALGGAEVAAGAAGAAGAGAGTAAAGGLAAVAGPIAIVVGSVAALAAGFAYLWNTSEDFRNKITELATSISEQLNPALGNLEQIFGAVSGFVTNVANAVGAFLLPVVEAVSKVGLQIADSIMPAINGALAFLAPLISQVASVLGPIIEWLGNFLGAVLGPIVEILGGVLATALQVICELLGGLFGFLGQVAEILGTITEGVGASFLTFLESMGIDTETLGTTISETWNGITSTISGAVEGARNSIHEAFEGARSKVSEVMSDIKLSVETSFEKVRTVIPEAVENAKTDAINKFNEIKDGAGRIFDEIRSKIEGAIEGAKNFVGDRINEIVGFFSNMHIEFPHINLPHFYAYGEFDPFAGKFPSIGIDWYAKAMGNGMILDHPTIFGMSGGQFLGAGEAGSETIVGTRSLMGMIRAAVEESANAQPIQVIVNAAPGMDVNELADLVAEKIDDKVNRKNRAWA